MPAIFPESVARPAGNPPRPTLILGIDPGLQRTGYALLSGDNDARDARLIEAGVVRLRRDRPLGERLVDLEKNLASLINEHRPTVLACEELYSHYKHPRTAILMGHARGVILALAARSGLEIVSVAATNAKKLLTGSGRASKRQVQLAVAALLGIAEIPEPNDVADAIAVGLCGLQLRHAANVTEDAKRV